MIPSLRLAVAALAALIAFSSCSQIAINVYDPVPPIAKIPDNPTFCYVPSESERAIIPAGACLADQAIHSMKKKQNSKLGYAFINAARSEGFKAVHADNYRTPTGYNFSSIQNPVFITFESVSGNDDYMSAATVSIRTNNPSFRFDRCVEDHHYIQCSYETYARGLVYQLTGQVKNHRILTVAPKSENTECLQAARLCKQEKWSDARVHAERSVQSFPNDSEAWYLFGIIERQLGNHLHSIQCFRRAYSLRACITYDAEVTNGLRYQKAMLNL